MSKDREFFLGWLSTRQCFLLVTASAVAVHLIIMVARELQWHGRFNQYPGVGELMIGFIFILSLFPRTFLRGIDKSRLRQWIIAVLFALGLPLLLWDILPFIPHGEEQAMRKIEDLWK